MFPFLSELCYNEPLRSAYVTVETIQRYYRINRDGIALLKFILESYDNAAFIRTVDRHGSIIEVFISPGFLPEVEAVIAELKDELNIQQVAPPEGIDPL
jgi:hypothetical protein